MALLVLNSATIESAWQTRETDKVRERERGKERKWSINNHNSQRYAVRDRVWWYKRNVIRSVNENTWCVTWCVRKQAGETTSRGEGWIAGNTSHLLSPTTCVHGVCIASIEDVAPSREMNAARDSAAERRSLPIYLRLSSFAFCRGSERRKEVGSSWGWRATRPECEGLISRGFGRAQPGPVRHMRTSNVTFSASVGKQVKHLLLFIPRLPWQSRQSTGYRQGQVGEAKKPLYFQVFYK